MNNSNEERTEERKTPELIEWISNFEEYMLQTAESQYRSNSFDDWARELDARDLFARTLNINVTFPVLLERVITSNPVLNKKFLPDITSLNRNDISIEELDSILENSNSDWLGTFFERLSERIDSNIIGRLIETSHQQFEVYKQNYPDSVPLALQHLQCNLRSLGSLFSIGIPSEITTQNVADIVQRFSRDLITMTDSVHCDYFDILKTLAQGFPPAVSIELLTFAAALELKFSVYGVNKLRFVRFMQYLSRFSYSKEALEEKTRSLFNNTKVLSWVVNLAHNKEYFSEFHGQTHNMLNTRLKRVGGNFTFSTLDKEKYVDFASMSQDTVRKYFVAGIDAILSGHYVFRFGTGSLSRKFYPNRNRPYSTACNLDLIHYEFLINSQIQSLIDALIMGLYVKGENQEGIEKEIHTFFRERFKAEFVVNNIVEPAVLSALSDQRLGFRIFGKEYALLDLTGYNNPNMVFGHAYLPKAIEFFRIDKPRLSSFSRRLLIEDGNELDTEEIAEILKKKGRIWLSTAQDDDSILSDFFALSCIRDLYYVLAKFATHSSDNFRDQLPVGYLLSDAVFSGLSDPRAAQKGCMVYVLNCENREHLNNTVLKYDGYSEILRDLRNNPEDIYVRMSNPAFPLRIMNTESALEHWLAQGAKNGIFLPIEDITCLSAYDDLVSFIIPVIGYQAIENRYLALHAYPVKPGKALVYEYKGNLHYIEPDDSEVGDPESAAWMKYYESPTDNRHITVRRSVAIYPIAQGAVTPHSIDDIRLNCVSEGGYTFLCDQVSILGYHIPEPEYKAINGRMFLRELKTNLDQTNFRNFSSSLYRMEIGHHFPSLNQFSLFRSTPECLSAVIADDEFSVESIDKNDFLSREKKQFENDIFLIIQAGSCTSDEIDRLNEIVLTLEKCDIVSNIIIFTNNKSDEEQLCKGLYIRGANYRYPCETRWALNENLRITQLPSMPIVDGDNSCILSEEAQTQLNEKLTTHIQNIMEGAHVSGLSRGMGQKVIRCLEEAYANIPGKSSGERDIRQEIENNMKRFLLDLASESEKACQVAEGVKKIFAFLTAYPENPMRYPEISREDMRFLMNAGVRDFVYRTLGHLTTIEAFLDEGLPVNPVFQLDDTDKRVFSVLFGDAIWDPEIENEGNTLYNILRNSGYPLYIFLLLLSQERTEAIDDMEGYMKKLTKEGAGIVGYGVPALCKWLHQKKNWDIVADTQTVVLSADIQASHAKSVIEHLPQQCKYEPIVRMLESNEDLSDKYFAVSITTDNNNASSCNLMFLPYEALREVISRDVNSVPETLVREQFPFVLAAECFGDTMLLRLLPFLNNEARNYLSEENKPSLFSTVIYTDQNDCEGDKKVPIYLNSLPFFLGNSLLWSDEDIPVSLLPKLEVEFEGDPNFLDTCIEKGDVL